jgi:hypothetical protein
MALTHDNQPIDRPARENCRQSASPKPYSRNPGGTRNNHSRGTHRPRASWIDEGDSCANTGKSSTPKKQENV